MKDKSQLKKFHWQYIIVDEVRYLCMYGCMDEELVEKYKLVAQRDMHTVTSQHHVLFENHFRYLRIHHNST